MFDPHPTRPALHLLAAVQPNEAAEAERRREDAILIEAAVIRARRAQGVSAKRATVHAGDRR